MQMRISEQNCFTGGILADIADTSTGGIIHATATKQSPQGGCSSLENFIFFSI